MKSFLKSASIIFVLAIVASFIADRRPEQASQLGLVILLISLFALLKPLPQIQLGHRGFSAAVALFVGFPMAVIGTADNTSQQDRNAVEAVSTKIASENTEAGSENEAPAAAASAPTDVARLEPVAEDEAESDHTSAYLEQLDREIAAIGNLDVSKYTSSQRDILTGTILIGTWSLLYDRGGPYQLDETGEAKRPGIQTAGANRSSTNVPCYARCLRTSGPAEALGS